MALQRRCGSLRETVLCGFLSEFSNLLHGLSGSFSISISELLSGLFQQSIDLVYVLLAGF